MNLIFKGLNRNRFGRKFNYLQFFLQKILIDERSSLAENALLKFSDRLRDFLQQPSRSGCGAADAYGFRTGKPFRGNLRRIRDVVGTPVDRAAEVAEHFPV